MRWSILTPEGTLLLGSRRSVARARPRCRAKSQAPAEDGLEELWRTYYGSIFNPARMNLRAMRSEMPMRYWKNLPELESLPELMRRAEERVATMIANARPHAGDPVCSGRAHASRPARGASTMPGMLSSTSAPRRWSSARVRPAQA